MALYCTVLYCTRTGGLKAENAMLALELDNALEQLEAARSEVRTLRDTAHSPCTVLHVVWCGVLCCVWYAMLCNAAFSDFHCFMAVLCYVCYVWCGVHPSLPSPLPLSRSHTHRLR